MSVTPAQFYESGAALWITGDDGVAREYAPPFVAERLIDHMRAKVDETVAFAKAHGLTDEMYAKWKTTSG